MSRAPSAGRPMLSLHQVAARLGLSYQTVYQLVQTKQLRAGKFGSGTRSALRVDPADLDVFIAESQDRVGSARVDGMSRPAAPRAPSSLASTPSSRRLTRAEECARLGITPHHEFVS